jgi:hypothetical protein
MSRPDVVKLHMTPAVNGATGERFCAVDVRDPRSRQLVFFGTVASVAGWLQRHGFAYVTGSNGLWAKTQ